MSVRVRYAPSPTGNQHIGGLRTALFNYLFAKANNGKFILRIEDTDRERFKKDALQDIYNTFDWLGFHWDEGPDRGGEYGPYFQSERKEIYREYADKLLESGKAYYCYCSSERLEELRNSKQFGYDRKCRNLSVEEKKQFQSSGIKSVIRLKIPMEGVTEFHDEVLGKIKRGNKDISPDPVILKSDGFPTYHLANVVDDHLMEITHILRAQEWIPSVPIHIHLYKAFGWEPPRFCHLPMVIGKDGQKLSKRHGSTSVIEFIKAGYLPEAIINYVSLLGWSFDDKREFFTLEELEKLFSIEKLNKSPAVFDYKKLDWFSGMYIRKLENKDLKQKILPYLKESGFIAEPLSELQEEIVDKLLPLVKERLKHISDVTGLVGFLFNEVEVKAEDLIPKRLDKDKTLEVLEECTKLLMDFEKISDEVHEQNFRDASEKLGVKLGDMLFPFRVAITGSTVSPPLFESVRCFGVDKSISRLKNAIGILR